MKDKVQSLQSLRLPI